MEKFLEIVLQAGGHWGLIVAALVWTIRELDRRNAKMQEAHTLALAQAQANERTEHEKRLDDRREFTRTLIDQTNQIHDTMDQMAKVVEMVTSGPKIPRLPAMPSRLR